MEINNKNMEKFVELSNALGQSEASETTVALFNSVRNIKKDSKGQYIERAIRPHKNGVIVVKEYVK